jgi:predicted RNA binding protein YcfA (HicA-like mRNA interferase family)
MTGDEVLRCIKQRGGKVLRQKGSHVRCCCTCGKNHTTVANHQGQDIPVGTKKAIEKDLAPCPHFGPGWLR